MKTLILGSRGMLGQELAEVFKDARPILWDKLEIDIANQKEVQEKISRLRPEIIINAAAYTNVDGAEINQELAKKINGEAVGYLALAASVIGAVFIHYSTDYVFDGQKKDGYLEDDHPRNPLNIYGQSKLFGENLLLKNCQKFYLIRTSGLFGSRGKNFVDSIFQKAEENKELRVVDDQYFKPTYAPDLAQKTCQLIESKLPFGVYHLTNEEATTWYDFAKEILRKGRKNISISPCSSAQYHLPARRPKYSILLNIKLPPLRPWQEALGEFIAHNGSEVRE